MKPNDFFAMESNKASKSNPDVAIKKRRRSTPFLRALTVVGFDSSCHVSG